MDTVAVSVVTATYHREDLLRRCVESVLAQPGVAFEHIVINDSGLALAPAAWMEDTRVRVITTQRTERCVARNVGAALARGQWLYFLDDDDYALPGAFAAMLVAASNRSSLAPGQTTLIYGGYQILNVGTSKLGTIVPELPSDVFPMLFAGEAFPTHATWLLREAFFTVGCFDPQMIYAEDVDLFRRVARIGGAARTEQIVAVARVEHPTTTTNPVQRRVKWEQSIEKCLAVDDMLARVLRGTHGSSYWRGRCARIYAASAGRRLAQRQYGLALSRATAFVRLSGRHCALPAFWRGFKRRLRLPQIGSGSLLTPSDEPPSGGQVQREFA